MRQLYSLHISLPIGANITAFINRNFIGITAEYTQAVLLKDDFVVLRKNPTESPLSAPWSSRLDGKHDSPKSSILLTTPVYFVFFSFPKHALKAYVDFKTF